MNVVEFNVLCKFLPVWDQCSMGARKETTARPATRKDSRSPSLPPAELEAEKATFLVID